MLKTFNKIVGSRKLLGNQVVFLAVPSFTNQLSEAGMNPDDLKKLKVTGGCAMGDLQDADLRGIDLRGVNLLAANLS